MFQPPELFRAEEVINKMVEASAGARCFSTPSWPGDLSADLKVLKARVHARGG